MHARAHRPTFILTYVLACIRGRVRCQLVGSQVGLKMETPQAATAEQHYNEHREKPFFSGLVRYFTSGPVVFMVWEGADVIASSRKIIGSTRPHLAEVGTIRGDLATSMGRNLIHGSDSAEAAIREIQLWFKPVEVSNWLRAAEDWHSGDD
jgi:nucleoside-diphosphate kinase